MRGLGCLLGLLLAGNVWAAGAVFSKDGKSVTLLPQEGAADHLWRVDLKTKARVNIPLELPKDEVARSIALGAEGELIVLTEKAVYLHDAKGTKKLCDTDGVKKPGDLVIVPSKARDGMADWIVVTGEEKDAREGKEPGRVCYARKPGAKSFVEVFGRRIDGIGEGAFGADGRYLFLADHALWEGHFAYEPDNGPGGWTVLLVGAGIADLEYCDSNMSNTGSYLMGDEIAVVGKNAYLILSGRHGADLLLRVTVPAQLPACDGTDSSEALVRHYAMQAKVLSSVKVLADVGYAGCLATASVNGEERVFYVEQRPGKGEGRMMLWSSKAPEPEELGTFPSDE